MGIKGLPAFLKRRVPSAFVALKSIRDVAEFVTSVASSGEPCHASDTQADTAAAAAPSTRSTVPAVVVDTPSIFYRVMYSAVNVQEGSMCVVRTFGQLRQLGVRVLFVFDGRHKPNKGPEHERRGQKRKAMEDKLTAIDKQMEEAMDNVSGGQDAMANIFALQEQKAKLEKNNLSVTRADYSHLKRVLTVHGFPCYTAYDEGENACSWFVKHGFAHVVISEDFDTLTCGVNYFVRQFSAVKECQLVKLQTVLAGLGLTYDMFVEFCVLCGSDFTVHLYKMGPAKAIKTIGVYKTISRYVASDEFKKDYGTVDFNAPVAVNQFVNVPPPLVSKQMACGALTCLIIKWLTRPEVDMGEFLGWR